MLSLVIDNLNKNGSTGTFTNEDIYVETSDLTNISPEVRNGVNTNKTIQYNVNDRSGRF